MSDILIKLGSLAGGARFRRISEKLYIDGNDAYKKSNLGFKATWFPIYYALATSSTPLSILDLAQIIGFSHITVKNVVRELEQAELIIISPNPDDKRSKLIQLSENGYKMLEKVKPFWLDIEQVLQRIFNEGHPDFLNILSRIDAEINRDSLYEKLQKLDEEPVRIVDFRPSLKKYFFELAGNWLLELLDGKLEPEDEFVFNHPEKAYLETGGFLFFALYQNEVVGCVGLKRLDENTFEFVKLFVNPKCRGLGVATKLIERCISRCKENEATELWLQTTNSLKPAHKLYYKLGFEDQLPPKQMTVLERTEKVMKLEL